MQTGSPDTRYHSFHVAQLTKNERGLRSEANLEPALHTADCVVVVTDHSVYDSATLARIPAAVVDTRHVVS